VRIASANTSCSHAKLTATVPPCVDLPCEDAALHTLLARRTCVRVDTCGSLAVLAGLGAVPFILCALHLYFKYPCRTSAACSRRPRMTGSFGSFLLDLFADFLQYGLDSRPVSLLHTHTLDKNGSVSNPMELESLQNNNPTCFMEYDANQSHGSRLRLQRKNIEDYYPVQKHDQDVPNTEIVQTATAVLIAKISGNFVLVSGSQLSRVLCTIDNLQVRLHPHVV